MSRVHVVFNDAGEIVEYALRPSDAYLWASMMLALDPDTWESVRRGLRVQVRNLDAFVLRRALRGAPLPDPDEYIEVSLEMLEAITEAGPLPAEQQKGRKR